MRKRGATIIELLIGLILTCIVLYGSAQLMTAGFVAHDRTNDMSAMHRQAREAIDTLADHLRNAQMNTNAAFAVDSSLHEATPTSVTYYTSSAGDTVTYELKAGALLRTADGATTAVVSGVTNLNFEYFRLTTYNSSWAAIAGTTATTGELPFIGLVKISARITVNGVTGSYETTVRLRNSPRKTRLSGG